MKQWEDWLARCCQQGLNLQPLGHKEALPANVPQLQRHFVEVSDHAHFQSKLIETRQKSKLFWMVHVAVGCFCSVWYTFIWIRKYQNTHSRYTTFFSWQYEWWKHWSRLQYNNKNIPNPHTYNRDSLTDGVARIIIFSTIFSLTPYAAARVWTHVLLPVSLSVQSKLFARIFWLSQ